MNKDELPTKEILDKFFNQSGGQDSSNTLVRHQIESMNEFLDKKLIQIIQGFNSIQVYHNYSPELKDFKYKINLNIMHPSLTKPVYQTTDGTQMLMTPNLARMNNLTYASNLYVDVHVITDIINDDNVIERKETTIPNVCIGKLPIMVRSKACILTQMPDVTDGECRYDFGAYFIVNGNEKVIICQDRISENKTLIFAPNGNGDGLSAEIRSMPDGMFLPPKTTSLHLSGKPNHMGNVIKLSASFLRSEIPLFIMFRALGVESDKEIYAHILLDVYSEKYQRISAQLGACAEDASDIHTQNDALVYLLKFLGTTGTPKEYLEQPEKAINILKNTIRNDFLSHVGGSFRKKALYLGSMVKKLLMIHMGYMEFDNRDSYLHKRIDTPGILYSNLFRQCYGKMIKEVRNLIVRELNLWRANPNIPLQLITVNNVHRFFKQNVIETGLRYALSTGNWGIKSIGSFQNIRQGVAQMYNRMSYLSSLSHLRRINTPMEKNGKLVQPRKLENSQFGVICPNETPEGSAVGLVKNMALSTHITTSISSVYVRKVIEELGTKLYTDEVADPIAFLHAMGSDSAVRIIINGDIIGYHDNPVEFYYKMRHLKRYGTIPPMTSIVWDIRYSTISISTEAGRMTRPLYIVNNEGGLEIFKFLKDIDKMTFQQFVAPLTDDTTEGFIEYLDVDEIDKAMIAMFPADLARGIKGNSLPPKFTHCEIHPSLLNGVLAGNIPFMDHNQAPRNCYQCLWIEEPVLCSNGTTKPIKNITIGDSVVCFNPVTMVASNTKVIHQYVRPAMKPVYCIYTLSGRAIVATQDHKFITNRGWADLIQFKPDTKMGIYPRAKNIYMDFGDKTEIAIEVSESKQIFMKSIGWYPLITGDSRLPILARILGFLVSNKMMRFETIADMERFDDDISLIGFKDGHRTHDFIELMSILKTEDVPEWILGAPLLIQREFISGYMSVVNAVMTDSVRSILGKVNEDYYPAYNFNYTLRIASTREYNRYVNYTETENRNRKDGKVQKIMSVEEWMRTIEFKGNLMFVPFSHSLKMRNIMISDITVESDNHSFIGGDGFAVSNSAMGKQAVGVYMTNFNERLDTMAHVLHYPQKPLVHTMLSKYTFSDQMPYGINAIVAIMTHTGFNQEDSVMVNKSAIDRGLFTSTYFKSYRDQCSKNHSTGEEEIFTKPIVEETGRVKPYNYDKLGEDGFIPKNEYVTPSDILVGKIMPYKSQGTVHARDTSLQVKGNDEGHVDYNYTGTNGEGYKFCKVRLRKYRKLMVGDKLACYSKDHEVLTTDGWIGISELTLEHKVATMVDEALVYQNPTELQKYDYKGKMYSVESNHVSLLVTPNHRMYIRRENKNSTYRTVPVEYAKENKKKKTIEIESLLGTKYKCKKNVNVWIPEIDDQEYPWCLYLNKEGKITHYRFPGYTDGNGKEHDTLYVDIDSWITFYGIYVAEGCVGQYQIVYAANKPRVQEALDAAAAKSGLKLTKNMEKGERVKWNLWCRHAVNEIGKGHIAINKRLQDWVWSLERDQCQKLVHAMCLGDGGQMENGTWRYYTSSTGLADDFQRLCLHAGYSCNKKLKSEKGTVCNSFTKKDGTQCVTNADYWVLTIITSQNEPLINKYIREKNIQQDSWVDFDDKVYCCTVPRGEGIIYIRRKGLVFWCAQSRSAQKGCTGMIYHQSDMPFSKNGITPDIIMNPHAIPSRMTMGQLMECIMGKAGCYIGARGDSTPFTDCSVEDISSVLERSGYEKYGNEILYDGRTGRQLQTEIFIGPTYYQRLKHMVSDKIHCLKPDRTVLCNDGWKKIQDIKMTDKVAVLKDGKLVYEYPEAVLEFPDYEGEMYHISNKYIDLDVTVNHKMYVSFYNTYVRDWSDYRLVEAEKIIGKEVKYKKDAEWDLPDSTDFGNVEIESNRLPEWCFKLSRKQSQIFIDSLNLHFTELSDELFDDIQRVCIHAGWDILRSEDKKVSIIKTDINPIVNGKLSTQKEYTYHYKGSVYCLTVSSGVFMVRHNGKAVWTGNSRGSNGPIVMLTRQPAEGRARAGGLRFGEMERDAIVAHGASAFLKERMLDVSDNFRVFICRKCGLIATANPEKNIYKCTNCKNNADINQVRMPYSMKLLLQELLTMNVAGRIIV